MKMYQPIKVVLVDDEKHCTESLSIQLEQLDIPTIVLGKFNDPLTAMAFLKENSCDMLFLDIEMPAMSGFDLLNRLNRFSFDVVFTTAYDQYAIKAFQFSALSYLLKPIDEIELTDCINRWLEKKQKTLQTDQFSFMLDMLKNSAKLQTKVALPTTDGLEFIEITKIIRCQAESNYTHIYLQDNISFLICRTLKDVDSILRPNGFLRIHQSHLVNPQHLKRYVRSDGGYVVMSDDAQLSISKANKQQVLEVVNAIERL
ncbi:DNA-binding response regulator [Chryseotalea sanaruensis]|uniref:DNA-binding response regulator n=1 Tax=Chryseotalea sanaruensis TaxID=2482724 RepID=A0A401UAT0_9BACT|nr:LytTR family DNA-binding domain-containing protein [Chryseotalea sanaruensis]GCC52016.1 DNA-binding response regulator [Chryseotalea sanaruensis]